MQSIEHTLRGLDGTAHEKALRLGRLEKALTDYQTEAGRPFEHDARLKECSPARRSSTPPWTSTKAMRRPSSRRRQLSSLQWNFKSGNPPR